MTPVDALLGLPPVAAASTWATRHRLRVVAYHGVPDPAAFAAQLDFLARRFRIVTGEDVAAAVRAGRHMHDNALWLTFDDGCRSVVEHALPLLTERGLTATAFICPGLVESGKPYWWSAVDAALAAGPVQFGGRTWTDRALVTYLKSVDDLSRRAFVTSLAAPTDVGDPSMDSNDLKDWVSAGMEVGNHTWDHPCLPQCSPEEQRRQIMEAHDWISDRLGSRCKLFAFPNGDGDHTARTTIAEMGEQLAVGFDHRLVAHRPDPLAVSRLRLDADSPMNRTRAVVSGDHSGLFALRTRVREVLHR